MKSLLRKSLHTGLGVLGNGKTALERFGRDLAKKAQISEKDGEKIARQLQTRSEKAVDTLHKNLSSEVSKVVAKLRAAVHEDVKAVKPKKHKAARAGKVRHTRKHRTAHAGKGGHAAAHKTGT